MRTIGAPLEEVQVTTVVMPEDEDKRSEPKLPAMPEDAPGKANPFSAGNCLGRRRVAPEGKCYADEQVLAKGRLEGSIRDKCSKMGFNKARLVTC